MVLGPQPNTPHFISKIRLPTCVKMRHETLFPPITMSLSNDSVGKKIRSILTKFEKNASNCLKQRKIYISEGIIAWGPSCWKDHFSLITFIRIAHQNRKAGHVIGRKNKGLLPDGTTKKGLVSGGPFLMEKKSFPPRYCWLLPCCFSEWP